MKYFTLWFWSYIFHRPMRSRYNDEWHWKLRLIWCRMRNHPAGVVWYNPNGYEPDMTCKNCGEDIG